MASLDANENAPTPKRPCKPSHPVHPSPQKKLPVADNVPIKIDRENFFGSISLKPNGLFDLPDLNEHFNKQLDEVSSYNMSHIIGGSTLDRNICVTFGFRVAHIRVQLVSVCTHKSETLFHVKFKTIGGQHITV